LVDGFSLIISGSFGLFAAVSEEGGCLRRFRLARKAAASFSVGLFAIRTALYLGLILTL
jgi:hypothetical protein